MFPYVSLIRKWWSSRPGTRVPNRRQAARRKLNLLVEPLEQRDVPTILFQPFYGPETTASDSHNAGAQSPTVNVVFAGSYWNTANGKSDMNTFRSSMQSILSGPYLSGLTQYGSDGKALYGKDWVDTTFTLSEGSDGNLTRPNGTQLQQFLQTSLTGHNAFPGVHDAQHAPIEVVISDPADSTDSGGYNSPGTYNFMQMVSEKMTMIYMGTIRGPDGVHVNKDWVTTIFGHEVAEALSDPGGQGAHFVKPAGQLDLGDQVADNEAEMDTHYGYFLDGNWVQPYWSARDQAWILPDHNQQTFALTPIWNTTYVTLPYTSYHIPVHAFTGNYTLNVTGDQLGANFADAIHVNGSSDGTVSVTLNNESATFRAKDDISSTSIAVKTINVDSAGGSNKVTVDGVPAGAALTIASTGVNSFDSILFGSQGSLAAIQGTVNVSNSFNRSSVVIDDSADVARNITLTNHSVTIPGATTINYVAAYQPVILGFQFPPVGVTSLTVQESIGSRIDAESVGALTVTSADWYGTNPGSPVVYGPAANKVHLIYPIVLHA